MTNNMKFGLIGHPIEHSLSPALFKAGYDGRYPYELIQTPDFEEAYARFLADYDGINVTAPFKELAIKKADILSEECQAIGATNLLVKTAEGIKNVKKKFLETLQSLEVEEIDPVGQPFDPNVAEAVMQVESTDGEESDTVKQVFQKGYRKKDKIIRYAKVSVTK